MHWATRPAQHLLSMEPQNIRFGGGATETLLHPLVAVWLLMAIVLILTRPREEGLTVFLLSCFTIPIGQVVVLGGLHFTVLRILILAVLARMAAFRGRLRRKGLRGDSTAWTGWWFCGRFRRWWFFLSSGWRCRRSSIT